MKFSTKGVQILRGIGLQLVVPIPLSLGIEFNVDPNETYVIDLKKARKIRSMNANAYAWVLCQKIAEKLIQQGAFTTKVDVYRDVIEEVGQFTPVPVKKEAVERFKEIWEANGLGWFVKEYGDCKTMNGYVTLLAYHGSSVYTQAEMTCLIEGLIQRAKEVGAEYLSEFEINQMLESWCCDDLKKSKSI